MLVTGQARFNQSLQEHTKKGLLGNLAMRAMVPLPDADQVDEERPTMAFVLRGQWVAGCPDCERAAGTPMSLHYVWLDDLRFMCSTCWNRGIQGAWRSVILVAEVEEITHLLEVRPVPKTRNWYGESLAQLRLENSQMEAINGLR